MKKLYTFLLAAAVFAGGVSLCSALERVGGGENITVQFEDESLPVRVALPSTDGYIELLPGETVNINTADAQQLAKLPGIGDVLAQRIIDHRLAHGPFGSIEEITAVEDIGEGRFEKIRSLICTGNE